MKSLFTFLITALLCYGFWLTAPLIAVADYSPFVDPTARSLGIGFIIGFVWIIYSGSNPKNYKSNIKVSKQEQKEIAKLKARFEGAVQFLKGNSVTTSANKKQRLYDLPWYLVMGEKEAGSTTLLKNSGLQTLLKKKEGVNQKTFQHCEWLGTRDAVLLDVNSHYFIHEKKQRKPRLYWFEFLSLLKKHRKPAINGVMLTISIEKYSTQTKKEQNISLKNLRKRLQELNVFFNTAFPVYLVFTQCDCLTGFNEFFSNLSQQDMRQIWGISFSREQIATSQAIADNFDAEYDNLLKRLNDRVIYRLHHERSQGKRALIKDFPLQMESIKKPVASMLASFANMATKKQPGQLRGVYFTAAHPQQQSVDRLLLPLSSTFAIQPYQEDEYSHQEKAFFTHRLFKDLLLKDVTYFSERSKVQENTNHWMQTIAITTASVLVVTCAVKWSQQFSSNIMQFNEVENALVRYNLLAETTDWTQTGTSLPALSSLQKATQLLIESSHPFTLPLSFAKKPELQQLAQKAYGNAAGRMISNELANIIKQQIELEQPNSSLLYGALKNYLGLGSNDISKRNELAIWLDHYWKNNTDNTPTTNAELKKHLQSFFNHGQSPIKLNRQLVSSAHEKLNQLSPQQLSMAVLNSDLIGGKTHIALPIPNDNQLLHVFTTDKKSFMIPSIHTAAKFTETYDVLIPQAVNSVLSGNGILQPRTQDDYIDRQTIVMDTRQLYMEDYISTWQNVLDSLELANFDNIENLIQLIDSLAKSQSPITNLLTIIRQNTNVTYKKIQTPISIRFQKYQRYFSRVQPGNIVATRAQLLQLEDYLSNLNNAHNLESASFYAAKTRMMNPNDSDALDELEKQAYLAPAPINKWLKTIVDNSWNLILNNAEHYLNLAWQNTVLPEYNTYIKDRYPVAADAKQEITSKHFDGFFSPQGILDTFYVGYLRPFVDINNGQLSLKNRNGQSLPLDEGTLAQIQRAEDIKLGYYKPGNQQVNIHFALKPEALQPMVKRFVVNIDNQQATTTQDKMHDMDFTWPTKQPAHSASLQLASVDGQLFNLSENGYWAWFKLLDKALVEKHEGSNNLGVTFDINGYGARYELLADTAVNPFTPELLHGFELGELG